MNETKLTSQPISVTFASHEEIAQARTAMKVCIAHIKQRFLPSTSQLIGIIGRLNKGFQDFVDKIMDARPSVSLKVTAKSSSTVRDLQVVKNDTQPIATVVSSVAAGGAHAVTVAVERVSRFMDTSTPKSRETSVCVWWLAPGEPGVSPTQACFQSRETILKHLKNPQVKVAANFGKLQTCYWEGRDPAKHIYIRVVMNIPERYWRAAQSLAGQGLGTAVVVSCNVLIKAVKEDASDVPIIKFTHEVYWDGCETCGRYFSEKNPEQGFKNFTCKECDDEARSKALT